MAKPKHSNIDPVVLATYRKMVSVVPEAEVKGNTMPYTSINGNMYSSIAKSNIIGVRLSEKARTAFLSAHDTTLYESIPGYVQKEYVAVPAALHDDMDALQSLFKDSFAYASGLKPKKTKR